MFDEFMEQYDFTACVFCGKKSVSDAIQYVRLAVLLHAPTNKEAEPVVGVGCPRVFPLHYLALIACGLLEHMTSCAK
jgi:hypothetical protein